MRHLKVVRLGCNRDQRLCRASRYLSNAVSGAFVSARSSGRRSASVGSTGTATTTAAALLYNVSVMLRQTEARYFALPGARR